MKASARPSRMRCFLLAILSILISAHRLPAPIVEEATPNPAPQESSQPKPRRTKARSATEGSENPTQQQESAKEHGATKPYATKMVTPTQPKFAGTWSGTITEFVWGTFDLTLVVNAPGTSVISKSKFGTKPHTTTCDGQTVTWREGVFNEVVWTFTPNSDGMTAEITANSPLGIHSATTLRRASTAEAVPQPATSAPAQTDIPTAKPVPGKPGFVFDPFDPTSKAYLDVRGMAPGTKVKILTSGKFFIVP